MFTDVACDSAQTNIVNTDLDENITCKEQFLTGKINSRKYEI